MTCTCCMHAGSTGRDAALGGRARRAYSPYLPARDTYAHKHADIHKQSHTHGQLHVKKTKRGLALGMQPTQAPHLTPFTSCVTPCTASPSCAIKLPILRCTCSSRPSLHANSSRPPSQQPSSVRGTCARVTRHNNARVIQVTRHTHVHHT
jgi:hypothetical protein